MTEADEVLTRDRSSGRVHKRYRVEGRLIVDERCNLDQSGAYDIIENTEGVDPGSLCERCFHTVEGVPV